jgi:hypothetical protein
VKDGNTKLQDFHKSLCEKLNIYIAKTSPHPIPKPALLEKIKFADDEFEDEEVEEDDTLHEDNMMVPLRSKKSRGSLNVMLGQTINVNQSNFQQSKTIWEKNILHPPVSAQPKSTAPDTVFGDFAKTNE